MSIKFNWQSKRKKSVWTWLAVPDPAAKYASILELLACGNLKVSEIHLSHLQYTRRKIPSSHFSKWTWNQPGLCRLQAVHQAQCPDLEAGGLVASARQGFTTLHIPGLCALNFPQWSFLTEFPQIADIHNSPWTLALTAGHAWMSCQALFLGPHGSQLIIMMFRKQTGKKFLKQINILHLICCFSELWMLMALFHVQSEVRQFPILLFRR